jgi:hypothetical protein
LVKLPLLCPPEGAELHGLVEQGLAVADKEKKAENMMANLTRRSRVFWVKAVRWMKR